MQRPAFFLFLAPAFIATLGATTALPTRPADGTYVYAISGTPGVTSSSVVVRTVGTTVSTTEVLSVAGTAITATTDYDTATLLPTHYHVIAYGKTTDVAFSGTTATVASPPLIFHANPGTDLLAVGDGLIAYTAMLPSVLAAHPGKPLSLFGINGGRVVTVESAPATSPRPAGVAAVDVAEAAKESVSGLTFAFWTNSATNAVDAFNRAGLSVRLTSYSPSTQTPVAPTPVPLAPPHYVDRDVRLASTGATISGTLSVPRGPAGRRYPAFVFVHGSGPGTRDGALAINPTFLDLGNALANAGYAVLRYDKRGVGKSTGTRSESWKVLGVDVQRAVAYLRAQSDVDPRRIFLLGHSEGGAIVPIIAPEFHPALAGIVMLAGPAISVSHILDEQASLMTPRIRAVEDATFSDYAGLEPSTYITKVDVPILVLQGTRDIQVLAKDLPPMIAAARKAKRKITVDVLGGDDHLFLNVPANQAADGSEYFVPAPLDPRVAEAILKWASLAK